MVVGLEEVSNGQVRPLKVSAELGDRPLNSANTLRGTDASAWTFFPLVLIPHHIFVLVANTLIANTLVADTLVLAAAYNEHTLHLNRLVLSSPFFIILIVIRNVYTIFILQ